MDDVGGVPISAHPVDGFEWSSDRTPWLRAFQSATLGEPGVGYAPCPFCGATTLKLSVRDVESDAGRLTTHCDNTNCEAREIEVLVCLDNGQSLGRADVRALRAIDAGKAKAIPRLPGRLIKASWDGERRDSSHVRLRRTTSESQELSF